MAIKDLNDKVAVVTGGGSGIGQALALQLAKKGCHLALVDVNRKGMQETKDKVANKEVEVTMHVADVSKESAMKKLADDVVGAHGKVNLLFNNAGITYAKSFEGHSLKDFSKNSSAPPASLSSSLMRPSRMSR